MIHAHDPSSGPGYRRCVRCIMDTSDPEILFDAEGICNHCVRAEGLIRDRLPLYQTGDYQVGKLIPRIQAAGRGRPYDCIVGVSGGTDSTYVAYQAKQLGLRPLAVHFDNGWNSELAVQNIAGTLAKMGIELFTYVVDWKQFRDLQLSFLKASVPDAEIPTDHGIWATLYRTAARFGAPYILSGTNIATESILPVRWTYGVTDWHYIRSVHRAFDGGSFSTYPRSGLLRFGWYVMVRKIRTVSLLNSVPYDKKEAQALLTREVGWRDYGGKHHESVYTRFFQSYILPRKFGIDKRKAHLSSLIMSGQLTRAEALAELELPVADPKLIQEDLEFVSKKFGMTVAEFERLLDRPIRSYRDYPNSSERIERLKGWVRGAQRRGLLPRQVGM